MKEITVIIVNWNTREFLGQCLNSIRKADVASLREIIVVDNASKDGSAEMIEQEFAEVTLIRAAENLGFARANNLAMGRATGSMFALVNSDALVHPGCLEALAVFLHQHDNVGMVGPRVIGADGHLQRTCRRLPSVWNTLCRALALDRAFPEWSMLSGFELPNWNHCRQMEVEVLSGCFCVVRKKAVDEVGGLDEQFFFYAEDIDWCKRFADAGWKLMFVPEATATHFGGGGTSTAPLLYSIEILRATLKYWRKHHGIAGEIVCYFLIFAHHGLRFLIRGVKRSLGLGNSVDSGHKLREDAVCLRWLLTGTGI